MKSEEMKIESRIRRRNEKQMVGFMESRIRRRNDKEIVGFEATEVDFVTPMLGFLFYVILLSFHFICITFIPMLPTTPMPLKLQIFCLLFFL